MSNLEESWIEDQILESYEGEGHGLRALPDTFRWAKLLANLLEDDEINSFLGMEAIQGVLLTGPYGSGKNTMATAILEEVPYNYLYLNGQNIDDESESIVIEKLDQIFSYMESSEDKLCVWLEHMGMSRHVKKIYDYVAVKFEEIVEEEKAFFIVVENDEKLVPAILRRNLFHCPLQLPDHEDKEAFFEEQLNNPNCMITILNTEASDLADMTEGFSYRQLEVLVTLLKMQLKENALDESDYVLSEGLQKIKDGSVYLKVEQAEAIIKMLRKTPETVSYMPAGVMTNLAMPVSQEESVKSRREAAKQTKAEQSYSEHLDDLIRRKHTLNMLSETGGKMVREKLGQE